MKQCDLFLLTDPVKLNVIKAGENIICFPFSVAFFVFLDLSFFNLGASVKLISQVFSV